MRNIRAGFFFLILMMVLMTAVVGSFVTSALDATEAASFLNKQQTVIVNVGSTTVNVAASAEIEVSLDVPADILYGTGEYLLIYDPSLLNIIDCTLNPTFFGVCNPTVPGEIRWNALTPAGFSGESVLITFQFETLQTGTAPLALEVNLLADTQGNNIDFSIQGGEVVISGDGPTPIPTVDGTACLTNPSIETCPLGLFLPFVEKN